MRRAYQWELEALEACIERKHDLCYPVSHKNSMNKSPSNRAMNCLKIWYKLINVKIYHSSHFFDNLWICFLSPARTQDRVHICFIFYSQHSTRWFADINSHEDGPNEWMLISRASLACKPQEDRLEVLFINMSSKEPRTVFCSEGAKYMLIQLKRNLCYPILLLIQASLPGNADWVSFSARHSSLLQSSCSASAACWYNALKHFLSQVFYTT